MTDEPTPKKVVKRVVKRPVASNQPLTPNRPVMRYGRPVDPPAATKVAARDAPAPAPTPTPTAPVAKQKKGPQRPSIPRPSVSVPRVDVKPAVDAVRARTTRVATAVGSRAGTAGRATGRFTADLWAAARTWRIPHLEPARASILAGFVTGLVSVGLGVGALRLFTEVRGVANGGPLWGSLTFVVVTLVAFALGERLLHAFGSDASRLTSFLGVVLTLTLILSVFLGLADSRYGLVIVPVVAAAAFWAAQALLQLAESAPADVE